MAEALETTVASVNSALQRRARAITAFVFPELFPRFGLPAELPREG
ncbi:MAG: hypothetical protein M3O25_09990 [Actinomycetota bacterium]|nr:hypothetical protein [Actinomycetota bacterium]